MRFAGTASSCFLSPRDFRLSCAEPVLLLAVLCAFLGSVFSLVAPFLALLVDALLLLLPAAFFVVAFAACFDRLPVEIDQGFAGNTETVPTIGAVGGSATGEKPFRGRDEATVEAFPKPFRWNLLAHF